MSLKKQTNYYLEMNCGNIRTIRKYLLQGDDS